MARLSAPVLVMLVLCGDNIASAQCIECKDCHGMSSCYQVCRMTCARQKPVVNGEICKTYGSGNGKSVAQEACGITQTYCSGKPPLAKSYFPVTLSQCANVAFGTCQNRAMDRNSSPCGWQFDGYQQCNSAKFMGFYTELVNEGCHKKVEWIKDVAALLG